MSQKDQIILQKDLIEEKNEEITGSINYAQRIQKAIIPDTDIIKRNFSDFFVLFLPRDIVSGDFYWIRERNNKVFITAADCTGHGVPGAFMSLLGITFLNEIITRIDAKDLRPDIVLNHLREMIIHSLRQKEEKEHTKDGIDMALIMIDKEKKKTIIELF